MDDKISDADLERFLRRRDRLTQEYAALGGEQPTAALDALVLERARTALADDLRQRSWRRRRWPALMALAATVVLSFAVITRIAMQPETLPVPISEQTIVREPAPVGEPQVDAPAVLSSEAVQDESVPRAPAPAAELPRAPMEKRMRATRELEEEEPPQAAMAPPAPPDLRPARESKREAYVSSGHATMSAADAPAAIAAPATSVPLASHQTTPQDWIEHIRALRAQGLVEESRQELTIFQRTHPGYTLPDDLKDLAPPPGREPPAPTR